MARARFALAEIQRYFSSLSALGFLTLKYQTDIEVKVFEMRKGVFSPG